MEISRFNPHAMADAQVRLLSTGRDRLIETVAQGLTEGPGVRQHILVTAPRGFGKSFFARAIQLAIADLGLNGRVTILPEEQRNVSTPSSFLREIARGLKGAPAASVAGLFLDDPPGAWEEAKAELLDLLAAQPADIVQIVVVENFDELITTIFDDPADQSKLRALLSETDRLALLATATSSNVDQDYEQRLFHSFAKFSLMPWSEEDHLLYFERRAVAEGHDPAELDRGKIRALARFTGGAPRMAVALANLLFENDPLSAAALLDKLVDDLTPYYQALIDQMPPRTKTLFDALIRQSEPCSQSDLAERVGTTQNRIAQHFAWLRERHLVIGRKRTGGRDFLYQVSDRLFVQYYRKRYLLHDRYTPLAGMAELLDGFFSAEENRAQAISLLDDGRELEACEFVRAYLSAGGGDLGKWAAETDNAEAIRGLAESLKPDSGQALPLFRKALVSARAGDDEIGTALLLGQIGILSSKDGQYGAAIDAHREALAIWQRIGQPRTIAWVLSQLAQDFRGALQFDDALHYAHAAITLWDKEGAEPRVASLWGEVGENLRRLGRPREAVEAFVNAERLWAATGNVAGQAWVLGGLGLARRDSGCFHEAIETHRRAIELLEHQNGRKFSIALNESWIASAFRELRDYRNALVHDRKALNLWSGSDPNRHAVKALSAIALNLIGLEQFSEALAATREAFDQARAGQYQSQILWSAGQLAFLHVREGNVAAIWRYIDEQPAGDARRLCEAILTQAGAALGRVEASEGREAAFARGAELLDSLKARVGPGPFYESATYLLSGLLATARAYPLLRDLTAEAAGTPDGLSEARREAIELASAYLESGRDETLIEQADPDVGDAVRAIISTIEARDRRAEEPARG